MVGMDPDRAAVWSRRVQSIGAYIIGLTPFAMAAAWRTFVHARRWLETGSSAAFTPAIRMYESAGFARCGAFDGYVENPFSIFMTRPL